MNAWLSTQAYHFLAYDNMLSIFHMFDAEYIAFDINTPLPASSPMNFLRRAFWHVTPTLLGLFYFRCQCTWGLQIVVECFDIANFRTLLHLELSLRQQSSCSLLSDESLLHQPLRQKDCYSCSKLPGMALGIDQPQLVESRPAGRVMKRKMKMGF